jgi:hypothetical protein
MTTELKLQELKEEKRKREIELQKSLEPLDITLLNSPTTMHSIAQMHRKQKKLIKVWYENSRALIQAGVDVKIDKTNNLPQKHNIKIFEVTKK